MQGELRPRPQVRLAAGGEHVVRRLAHERDQLRGAGQVDRLGSDVGLGVARAVPVEVVTAGSPADPFVLADADLLVRRAVGALDVAEGAPQGQLPADVRLGLDEVDALPQRECVQGAAVATGEAAAVVEDARAAVGGLHGAGLALAVLDLGPALARDLALAAERERAVLPQAVVEPLDPAGHPLLVLAVGEVCPERAAAGVRRGLVDPLAAVAEDAGPRRRQPGEIAAEDLALVRRVGELQPGAGENGIDLGHPGTLTLRWWSGRRRARR